MDATRFFQLAGDRSLPGPLSAGSQPSSVPSSAPSGAGSPLATSFSLIALVSLLFLGLCL